MDMQQDPREKRKRQNRNAQRRFRSRNRVNDTVLLDTMQMERNIGNVTMNHSVDPMAGCDVLGTFSPTTQREFQSYFGGLDVTSLPSGVASDDTAFAHSTLSMLRNGPRSGPLMSPLLEGAAPSNGEGYNPPDCELDHAAMMDARPPSFPSNGDYVHNSSRGLMSPISTLTNVETTRNAYSSPETGPVDMGSSHVQANHGTSFSAHERSRTGQVGQKASVPYTRQKAQQSQTVARQKVRGAENNSRRNLGCCVAHKAETMISEVQKLCKFGARFGLLEVEDEVQHHLNILGRKFHEMSKCSTRDDYESNSEDSEAD